MMIVCGSYGIHTSIQAAREWSKLYSLSIRIQENMLNATPFAEDFSAHPPKKEINMKIPDLVWTGESLILVSISSIILLTGLIGLLYSFLRSKRLKKKEEI